MNINRAVIAGLAAAGIAAGGTAVAIPAAADTEIYYQGYGPYKVLRQGAKGNEVLALQWMLNCEDCFVVKKPPGHFGDKTVKSVQRFQVTHMNASESEADGNVGALTWYGLYRDRKPMVYKQRNDCIKGLQVLLNKWKYNGMLVVDGKFGKATRQKVLRFQQAHRLSPTGQVDAKTFQALIYTKA
ncbi:hypothetical protein GCM10010191_51900 [Actinomadura vinacea]|uniref:Peptidoglycan binding-like domain-containing protein n=1 Tax=Actinomadura vinacea TaxID=115336 RepID=A0ABN3JM30_9ACTN